MSNSLMLSVRLMTYNHQDFILECLKGIDNQDTLFNFEVVIGDDFSTDNNVEYIQNFISSSTNDKIKYRLLSRVKGDEYHKERQLKGRLYNFIDIINNCKGKYIALLDGDDYWTDPYKLQKQVDFLEANEEYSGCFHKVKTLIGNEIKDDDGMEHRFEAIENKNKITATDLLKHNNFIHTCSFVFRNESLNIPIEMQLSPVGDVLLFFHLSKHKYFKRIDEFMAVYNRNSGTYSTLSSVELKKKNIQYTACLIGLCIDDNQKEIAIKKVYNHIEDYKVLIEKNKTKELMCVDNLSIQLSLKMIISILKRKITSKFISK